METISNKEHKTRGGGKPKFNKKKWRETQFSHKHKGMGFTNDLEWYIISSDMINSNKICSLFLSGGMGVKAETGCYTQIQQNDQEG